MYKDLQKISNYTKYLSALTVSNAKSGHTGAAVGMSDFLTVLYAKHLNFDINNPTAINRDRFVLSNGHASALLYSLLYMADHKDISIEDLKNFRQFNSKTAGHPEIEHLAGVDVSTGPLG
ncbi:MAG: Transketolase 1, partial [Proteobacteria bacterium]